MNIFLSKDYEYEFVVKVRDKISRDIRLLSNPLKLHKLDKYFQEIMLNYSTLDIIKFSCKHFVIIQYDEKYSIEIDKNVIYKDNVKVKELAKLINYGNLEVKGYPIYTKEFKSIEEHIDDLYVLYKSTGVVI